MIYKHIFRFLISTLILSSFVYIILKTGGFYLPAYFLYPGLEKLIVLFFIIEIIGFGILHKGSQQSSEKFVLIFMSYTTVKLLLLMSVAAYLIIEYSETAIPLSINFLFVYVFFTSFEVIHITKFLNKNTSS